MPISYALPKTLILGCEYISMARAAHDYTRLLSDLGCLARSVEEAEVVVVHGSLHQAKAICDLVAGIHARYLVGYLVWEADRLPVQAQKDVLAFDALWTPSWYSARSLTAVHSNVRWLPHVVRPYVQPSESAVARLEAALGPPGHCELLQIGRASDTRKAFVEGARAVRSAAYGRPGLTLLQKVMEPPRPGAGPIAVRRQGSVVEVAGHFDDDLMSALYARSHYVFSNHHAEGWGLTLSEGMAAGLPAIGSNYSGNLAFMSEDSCILIDGSEDEVRKTDASKIFQPPMRWHYSLPGHIEQAVARAYDMVGTAEYARMSLQASRMQRSYNDRHISVMMRGLLSEIASSGVAKP